MRPDDLRGIALATLTLGCVGCAAAATTALPGVDVSVSGLGATPEGLASAIRIILILTVLSLAPSILVVMTSFTRIVIVLSILRHALGMPQTPPNAVLISLALFLTVFNMMPTFERINATAFQPFASGKLDAAAAGESALTPLREFMIRQTREEDLALMVDIAHGARPKTLDDVKTSALVPAFMLSELKTAFQIGFMIFLPFLLVDLVVASILMSLGMLMVPPVTISLPLKILLFVLIDGWNIVVQSLMQSFH